MIVCKCIQKFRDNKGKIYGYRLIDLNQQTQDVTPDDLKRAIQNNQVNVINLQLTSDNRLLDKKEDKQLVNKEIMPNKVVCETYTKASNEKIDAEKLVYNVAHTIYKLLGHNRMVERMIELTGFDNSHGNIIDKRFEPEINYLGNYLVLAVTYFKDTNELLLALEDIREGNIYLELNCKYSDELATKLIQKFVQSIKTDK